MFTRWAALLFFTCAVAANAAQSAGAILLWEADLTKPGCQDLRIDNSFSSTRRIVVSGTRVVVVCDGVLRRGDRGQLTQMAHLITLNLKDGTVSEMRKMEAPLVGLRLFGTAAGQVILINGSDASVLNSDLAETVARRKLDGRGVNHISPDGTVVGYEHEDGVEMLDTRSLLPTGVELPEGTPDTITAHSAATRNRETTGEKRHFRYGKIETQKTSESLYSGGCGQGFFPEYLRDDRMLLTCGSSFQVQNGTHVFFRERFFGRHVMFAGVSRGGERFAVATIGGLSLDPWVLTAEEVRVYDLNSQKAIARIAVPIKIVSGEQAWSALSARGDLIVIGGPSTLKLYRLP